MPANGRWDVTWCLKGKSKGDYLYAGNIGPKSQEGTGGWK